MKGNCDWEEDYKKRYQVTEFFKGRKYHEEFLRKYGRVPNKSELIIFYYTRYIIGGKKATLPFLTDPWANELIEEYTHALATFGITVAQAI